MPTAPKKPQDHKPASNPDTTPTVVEFKGVEVTVPAQRDIPLDFLDLMTEGNVHGAFEALLGDQYAELRKTVIKTVGDLEDFSELVSDTASAKN